MLDASTRRSCLRAQPAPGLPVARLVVGRQVDEVAELLPRLFNLCRAAQSAAVEAALGRPVSSDGIAKEILRDHLIKFFVTWPAQFGCPPCPLPVDWAEGGHEFRQAVFGPAAKAPATPADLLSFLESGEGVAPILKKIDGCFAPGEAVADGLDPVTADTVWSVGQADNSVAARHADHPAMRHLGERMGRGPLWRAVGRLYDLCAAAGGDVPAIHRAGDGAAIVPAARGSYAVRIAAKDGVVVAFERVTPTDHLLAEGGVLDRVLETLPAHKAGLGPLLLDILDPCSPVRLKEVEHA